ncbi:hypothetical protein BLNAU_6162 [Blattamonas nauphoetae]|uniref:Uncharacterized protein n=1 Tax=Blattamonas nauphoetae TaxID=2049346 RepID=A0ABQ9Y5D8_9EUKA|nr:hypothetical protein BLNAU_6162 [Blattamonas nauphoetae]
MFETVDFEDVPLHDVETHVELTRFISTLTESIGEDEETFFNQYAILRVAVFEPATQYIIFIFNNWGKITMEDEDQYRLERYLCRLRFHINNMELRSGEHDAKIVSTLIKWELGQIRTQQQVKGQNQQSKEERRKVDGSQNGADTVTVLRESHRKEGTSPISLLSTLAPQIL